MTSNIASTRYSEVASNADVQGIQEIIAKMVSGGFAVASGNGDTRQLNNQERFAIASVAHHYGLDPLLGEVFLLGGKPYISTKAMMRVATESGRLARPWSVRPFSAEEAELWGLRQGEIGVIATVWVKGIEHPFEGMGTACAEDVGILRQRGGGVRHDPRIVRKQAINRAVRDVLGQAFGVATADADDIHDVNVVTGVQAPSSPALNASPAAQAIAGPRPSLGEALAQVTAQERAEDLPSTTKAAPAKAAPASAKPSHPNEPPRDLEFVPEEHAAEMDVQIIDDDLPPAAYSVRAPAETPRRIHEPVQDSPRAQRIGAPRQDDFSLSAPGNYRDRR